jgi:WD40 repeat protein
LHERFQREARAAARLTHPNIVPVFEIGEAGPTYYIASAYIAGQSLAEWLRSRTTPVPVTTAASIVAPLAEAMHYAHAQGVLHRDLKPANVLLEPREGEAGEYALTAGKITDFGLAKLLDLQDNETRAGAIIGTPAYMSPEQAKADQALIGTGSDIYGLGAILYELLTGRPPFQGKSDTETLYKLVAEEPVAPHRLNREVPRDLVAIALKCLEKQPAQRYASAGALADDLKRFMDGEATQARPLSALGLTWRWVGRNRRVAALLSIVALLLVSIASVSLLSALWIDDARRTAIAAAAHSQALEQSERRAREATEQGFQALTQREQELWRIAYASNSRKACEMLAVRNFDAVADYLERNRPSPGREDLRGFEWYFLWQLLHQQDHTRLDTDEETYCVQFSRDRRWLAAGTKLGTVFIWDAATLTYVHRWQAHSACVNKTVFSADGTLLATCGCDGLARVWRVGTWEQVGADLPHSRQWVGGADFLPDGRVLVTSTGDKSHTTAHAEITFWDLATGEALYKFDGGVGGIAAIRVALDGTRLVAVNTRGLLLLWELTEGKAPQPLDHDLNSDPPAVGVIPTLDLSADGRTAAYFGPTDDASVVDLTTARRMLFIRMKVPEDYLALSPGGEAIALSFGTLSTRSGALLESYISAAGSIYFINFSPTGERIAIAAQDHTVRVFARGNSARAVRRIDLAGITKLVQSGFAMPAGDDMWVVSGGDGLWAIDRVSSHRRKLETPCLAGANVVIESASPQGDYLAVRDLDHEFRRWLLHWPDHQGPIQASLEFSSDCPGTFSADGTKFVTYQNGRYEIRATTSGIIERSYLAELAPHPTLWPDGTALETTTPKGSYRIDLATGVIRSIGQGAWGARPVDNGNAILKSDFMTAWLEDAETGERIHALQDGAPLGISPDGKRVAVATQAGQVNLYDVMTGYDLGTIFDARIRPESAHFSADGRRLSVVTMQQPDDAEAIFELIAADPASTEIKPTEAAASVE